MALSPLNMISPVDGRYSEKTKELTQYFSEAALIRYRIQVEIEYFVALCEQDIGNLGEINPARYNDFREMYQRFTQADAEEVKRLERITNHDVKAVEYFVKERLENIELGNFKEFVHFGLTSQDINNTAMPLALQTSWYQVIQPLFGELIVRLNAKASSWHDIPMLAHTHGQPASPTKLGKEINVFIERLKKQFEPIKNISFTAKFGGATGNFNAHKAAYPDIDWPAFADHFLKEKLGLERQKYTTQIENYDDMATFFSALQRINTILIDFSRDIWSYISMNYFGQSIIENEVGSSAMPHKVNPIDFENAEGNLGLANAMLLHLEQNLPVSRLQRDLTDSTVSRNIGMPLAYMMIAMKSFMKGLDKLKVNEDKLNADLEANQSVVAEAIQTILRREGYPQPYEKLKELTRTNETITKEKIHNFIDDLDLNDKVKEELKQITPFNYTGVY